MQANAKLIGWLLLAMLGTLIALLLLPSVPPPKARAQRIQARNTLARISLTLTNSVAATNDLAPHVIRPR